jgi:streptogramin lyase
MTVDAKGNVWFGPYSNGAVAMFDAKAETFVQIPEHQREPPRRRRRPRRHGLGRLQRRRQQRLRPQPDRLQHDDRVQFHTFPQCGTPVGVSIDVDGFVWMVDHSGWAYRIDPETYEKVQVVVPGDHYTYSDMTGGGLVNAVVPG